ncbi:riboflavin biosynthesis protein PYRD, chloroplastic [Selaginella moellendorffii]|uniref:riboflavin biosynthesis protein PYRD, chloroplastic n=1 Tax=Selaginella moellendorffii TaxID=88036 RepID=UPI000D1C2304|nr:riboflavin biosynthesis protein PYRD, chloroplastic [Selaginella moellendorffii]|eukprot:XP_024530999.1 riboflavin biosynthesis protein PYRD, chloroplastic [Selaginella moellendorffii]
MLRMPPIVTWESTRFPRRTKICCSLRDDSDYMRQCVELARRGLGRTSPNPMVGCLIVDNAGEIVGRGFHPRAGEPHAEVFALREAGSKAHGSTAYVSLEPCDHVGRTPPCSRALVAARVRRVVVGTVDPNPLVAGKGVERLRRAGVEVTVGVEEELCRVTNEAFFHRMVTKKPFTCLRYAMTIDGCLLADPSTPVAASFYSQQLEEYDAVVTTEASLDADPVLLSAEQGAKQPLRVVAVTSSSSLSKLAGLLSARVFDTKLAPTLLVMDQQSLVEDVTKQLGGKGESIETVLRRKNVEVVPVNEVDLDSVLDLCNQRGACSVLLDSTAGFDMLGVKEALEDEDRAVIQKLCVVVGPFAGGGQSQKIASSMRKLGRLTTRKCGENVVIQGYFE